MWAPTYVDLPPDVICPTIPRVEPDLYTVGTDDLLNLSLNDQPGRITLNAIVSLNFSESSESTPQLHVVAEGGYEIHIEIAPDSDPSSSCYKISFDSEMSVHSLSIFAGDTPLDDSKPTQNVPFFMAVMSAEVTASPGTVSANVTHVGSASSASSSFTLSQPAGPAAASATSNSTPISATNSESSNLNIILPAVLVPFFVLLFGALGAYWCWCRSRRARMAPSAAFRAENPSMASGQPWVPIDEKRALMSE
ncbi:hypothetical protein EXIGLDRAFT_718003 [Exidia glandulosa HHB12029]|uniref:Uncharacterized protein n=1 Tax=Exidia glandulosa HHB12029 TaxID=1314781 RepID=A0A166AKJ8_EXIGL|nr:hypothetical protein EXIGLDRAFT_718003 [Exidia glandulosa HHB12029]